MQMIPVSHAHAAEPRYVFSVEKAQEARRFHARLPGYAPTPLRDLPGQARYLGIGRLLVKDESSRFGLKAFKALGGSFAMARLTAGKEEKQSFVTATDGNHGRGVAWAARLLGHDAWVFLPKGSSPERLENIRRLGARAEITDLNYDDCVRYAAALAREKGWTLLQDTAWDGYEEIPALIMQGYTTMGAEIAEQLEGSRPTHIFLQAGVGAMAGAMTGFFADLYRENKPLILLTEPEGADCLYRTALAKDGKLHRCRELHTIMAGLSCGEPCSIAWEVLQRWGDYVLRCPDAVAADGMRLLGNPAEGDPRIVSGESGAVTVGALNAILRPGADPAWRNRLGLDESSVVLCISTEGDTDRESYRKICWYGAHSGEDA